MATWNWTELMLLIILLSYKSWSTIENVIYSFVFYLYFYKLSDFAVGAPYDGPNGRGAVYIFYGSKDGTRKKHGQVIYAEAIQTRSGVSLSTFGFSISGGMDLDGNEYPDMAVGSYLSDAAFFFR